MLRPVLFFNEIFAVASKTDFFKNEQRSADESVEVVLLLESPLSETSTLLLLGRAV